jgi:hypothetical protein
VTQQQKLLDHIKATIGDDPGHWDRVESYGWPGEIEAAFIDSVLSVQAQYGNSEDRGVRLRVRHWRQRGGSGAAIVLDDLMELAKYDTDAEALADILDCQQTLSGKGRGRPRKALALAQAARLFVDNGISHASQISPTDDQKRQWRSVDGLGPATWHYVLMLLGKPDVKADTMITRFVERALGYRLPNELVRASVIDSASALGVSSTDLDFAIWSWQRRQQRTRRKDATDQDGLE